MGSCTAWSASGWRRSRCRRPGLQSLPQIFSLHRTNPFQTQSLFPRNFACYPQTWLADASFSSHVLPLLLSIGLPLSFLLHAFCLSLCLLLQYPSTVCFQDSLAGSSSIHHQLTYLSLRTPAPGNFVVMIFGSSLPFIVLKFFTLFQEFGMHLSHSFYLGILFSCFYLNLLVALSFQVESKSKFLLPTLKDNGLPVQVAWAAWVLGRSTCRCWPSRLCRRLV